MSFLQFSFNFIQLLVQPQRIVRKVGNAIRNFFGCIAKIKVEFHELVNIDLILSGQSLYVLLYDLEFETKKYFRHSFFVDSDVLYFEFMFDARTRQNLTNLLQFFFKGRQKRIILQSLSIFQGLCNVLIVNDKFSVAGLNYSLDLNDIRGQVDFRKQIYLLGYFLKMVLTRTHYETSDYDAIIMVLIATERVRFVLPYLYDILSWHIIIRYINHAGKSYQFLYLYKLKIIYLKPMNRFIIN